MSELSSTIKVENTTETSHTAINESLFGVCILQAGQSVVDHTNLGGLDDPMLFLFECLVHRFVEDVVNPRGLLVLLLLRLLLEPRVDEELEVDVFF